MNFKTNSRTDDVLSVIAIVVPLLFSASRLIDEQQTMDQIARAKAPTVQMADVDPAKEMFSMVMAG